MDGTGKISSTVSYAGGSVSVLSALTLTDWGILIGIATAIGTFALNLYYQHRRDQRGQELHDAEMERLRTAHVVMLPKGGDDGE
jgi:hypothetical protein